MAAAGWPATIAALAAAAGTQASERQPVHDPRALPVDHTLAVRIIQELAWSDPAQRLVITVTEPPSRDTQPSHLWIYSPALDVLRPFTSSAGSETQPRWSPDGRMLAFLSDREGAKALFIVRADGGEATSLTHTTEPIERFAWSMEGSRIAFLARAEATEEESNRQRDLDDGRVVDGERRTHLWIVDVPSGRVRQALGAPWRVSEAQWRARTGQLLLVATDEVNPDQETNRIFSFDPESGALHQLAAPAGPFRELTVSPDGKHFAYIGARFDGPIAHDLYVGATDQAGHTPENLTALRIDRAVVRYQWQSDDKLVVLVDDGFHSVLYSVTIQGQVRALASPAMKVRDFVLPAKGSALFAAERMSFPSELWAGLGRCVPRQISHFNGTLHQSLLSPEIVRYRSFDGRQIEAALLLDKSKPAAARPAIILVHGGPAAQWSDGTSGITSAGWGQRLAASGYVVLFPNIRGSSGYGYDFLASNRGDWGGADFRDILAGADYLIGRGLAAPDRLGIAGWSYGGYMAAWAATQTDRFKAAVSGAGISDLAYEFGTEESPAYDEWYFGAPYEHSERFRALSPMTYIARARTPMLILHGEKDTVDPPGQSQILYRALKRYGVPAELVMYPREGHVLKEQQHREDAARRVLTWFDRYLKTGGSP